MDEANDLFGLFNDDEEFGEGGSNFDVPVQIFVKESLAKDDAQVPILRQKLVQAYRDFKEKTNVSRYID